MTETPRMTVDDMDAAIEWLRVNEGDGGERESCERVASWLATEQSRRIERNGIRKIAREHGVPEKRARQAWKAIR